jgi:transcriptional antiterminator NusG
MEEELLIVTEDEELDEAEQDVDVDAAEAEAVEGAAAEVDAEETSEGEAADASAEGEEEEVLDPEDRARRLFASYLEPAPAQEPEPEPEPGPEPGPEVEAIEPAEPIALAALLGDEDLEEEEEEPEGEEEAEPRQEGRNWYVVHSYSGYENKVRKNLEHRIESLEMQHKIFEVVVPTEEEIELKDGQRRTVERRIFPGYILVDMIMDEDSWYVVRNTPGVTGFVGSVRKPTPLRQRDVDRILKRMRAETPKVKVSFRPGQKVRIADGPFEDFVGAVDEIYPEKGKVRILVSFFGRETPVELDFLQVEKIT